MGSSLSVYVGPVFKGTPTKVDGKKTVRHCSNLRCAKNVTDDFCKFCGSEVKEYERDIKLNNVSVWDLVEEIDQALMPFGDDLDPEKRFDIWCSNMLAKDGRREFRAEDAYVFVQVMPYQIQQEIEEFEAQFHDALEILKKAYGEGKWEISWGYIAEWN